MGPAHQGQQKRSLAKMTPLSTNAHQHETGAWKNQPVFVATSCDASWNNEKRIQKKSKTDLDISPLGFSTWSLHVGN